MIVIMSQVQAPLWGPVPADSEVVAKPERRVYTAEYKKRILAQADAAVEKGDIAKLLRREGLYSSTLAGWRRERESALDKAFSQKRGPEPKSNSLVGENEELRRQNKQLEEELRKAELIIEIQKKWRCCLANHCFRYPKARTPDEGGPGSRPERRDQACLRRTVCFPRFLLPAASRQSVPSRCRPATLFGTASRGGREGGGTGLSA